PKDHLLEPHRGAEFRTCRTPGLHFLWPRHSRRGRTKSRCHSHGGIRQRCPRRVIGTTTARVEERHPAAVGLPRCRKRLVGRPEKSAHAEIHIFIANRLTRYALRFANKWMLITV